MKRKLSFNDTDSSVVVSENEHLESELDFDPTHFLRCHSKIKTDAADVSTQIWQCSFEPDPTDPTKTTNLVATCGGDSVCFIDVRSGKVLRKYYSNYKSESFFALAWTTCDNYHHNENLLVVGGALCSIHFISPAKNTMLLEHKLTHNSRRNNKQKHISSLLFHKEDSNILFCSVSVGQIFIFDIGNPLVANHTNQITLLHTLMASSNELFTTTLSPDLNVLLAATDDCLRGWKLPDQLKKITTEELTFSFPASRTASESNTTLVDSVEALGGSLVATKCVLHGLIYVWDLKATLETGGKNATKFAVVPIRTLRWSDTDNFYMSMGYDAGSGLLACGDDKGALWLYDLFGPREETRRGDTKQPDAVLAWPEVVDEHIATKRKLRLDTYDIVVDKVAVGTCGRHLVAVTANNMVCIWQRIE